MNKRILLFSIVLYSNFLFSQKIDEQIELRIDNDQFTFQDRYYTNGVFLTYKRKVHSNFLFLKKDGGEIQYEISFGQQVYNPQKKRLTDINEFHRPFAGWLFGSFKVGKIKTKEAFFITLESGITGDESKAQDFQNWAHDALNFGREVFWIEQIEFKWLINLKAHYIYDLPLNENNTLQFETRPTIGTKDISFENGITYFFGKFNDLQNTSRLGIIDSKGKNEMFGFLSLGYNYVLHNTLIEGSLFKEDTLFTTDTTKSVVNWKFGIVNKHKKTTLKLIYNFNTKETEIANGHSYASLIVSRIF